MTKQICLCLLALMMASCGYGSRTYNPGMPGAGGAPPMISMLSPSTVIAGTSALAMTVNGSNFGSDAIVYWNSQPMGTMFVSANQVVASIPASDVATVATVPVYVRTGGVNSNTMNFTVQ